MSGARNYTFAQALGPAREILPGRSEQGWRALLAPAALALRPGLGQGASASIVDDIEDSGFGYAAGGSPVHGRRPYPYNGTIYPPPAVQCGAHPHQRLLFLPNSSHDIYGMPNGEWWCPWCGEARALAADRRAAEAAEDRLAFWPR